MAADGASVTKEPPPEVRAILKEWCDMQREKYGPDWKRILAREMADDFEKFLKRVRYARI